MELLPRAAELLVRGGGKLSLLTGRDSLPFPLPECIQRIASNVPAGGPWQRARAEGRALRAALQEAQRCGQPFDLVHTAHLPVPRRLGAPFTVTLHDLRDLSPDAPIHRRLPARYLLPSVIARAACVVTVSDWMRREIEQRFGATRVRVVSNAADHLRPIERDPDAADAGFLLHMGHVEPRKNLGLLLEVLARDRSLPRLVLAGGAKGDEAQRLARQAARLGVLDRVEFRGPVSDGELVDLYARAGCVVLPSRLEGFGIVALEAQCAGIPLAIANIPALVEIAGPDVPSFAPSDPLGALSAVRSALASTPDVLHKRATRAAGYRWQESAERWVEAWCELVR